MNLQHLQHSFALLGLTTSVPRVHGELLFPPWNLGACRFVPSKHNGRLKAITFAKVSWAQQQLLRTEHSSLPSRHHGSY